MKAQYNVGLHLYEGLGVDQDDEEAFRWFSKTANQNHEQAIRMLISMYYLGRGVAENPAKEVELYNKLLRQLGNTDPQNQYILGAYYKEGHGTVVDYKEAMNWFLKAANQQNTDAMYEIALLYEKGLGVQKGKKLAREWLTKASKLGHQEAAETLEMMKKN